MTTPFVVGSLLVSDSFNRANSASVGSTDGGSLGPLAWTPAVDAALSSWKIDSNQLASNSDGIALEPLGWTAERRGWGQWSLYRLVRAVSAASTTVRTAILNQRAALDALLAALETP